MKNCVNISDYMWANIIRTSLLEEAAQDRMKRPDKTPTDEEVALVKKIMVELPPMTIPGI